MGKTLTLFILGGTILIAVMGYLSPVYVAHAGDEQPPQVILEADSVVYDQQAGTARAVGNAQARMGLLRLSADLIELDEEMTRLKASSREERGVHVRYGARSLDGNDLEYRLDDQVGVMRKTRGEANAIRFDGDSVEFASIAAAKAKGWIKPKQARGTASDDLFLRGSDMSFTTCTEVQPAYRLKTKRLLIIPGRRVIAVKPQIFIEEHLLATYPFDYRIDLERSVAKPLVPSFFHDGTRGAGLAFRYGFLAGDSLEGDVDLRISTNQGIEGSAGVSFLPFAGGEAFFNTSYLYNENDGEKLWRPSWGLRSPGSEPDGFSWALLWSQRESVDIRQGTGRTYKGTLWRDPELTIASPWWGGEASGESRYRLLAMWGRYEEEGLAFERKGLGIEFEGQTGSKDALEPFWRGRAIRYEYDTGDDRTVLEGSLGVRWERSGWLFESRYDKRWIDGETPMSWDDLEELEEFYQTVDWPLSARWRFAVRAGYDLSGERFHEMAYRLAYDRKCYRFELFFVDDRVENDDKVGISLQITAFPDNTLLFLDSETGGFSEYGEVFP